MPISSPTSGGPCAGCPDPSECGVAARSALGREQADATDMEAEELPAAAQCTQEPPPAGHVYVFPNPFGDHWSLSSNRWNGQEPKESRPFWFAQPAIPEPTCNHVGHPSCGICHGNVSHCPRYNPPSPPTAAVQRQPEQPRPNVTKWELTTDPLIVRRMGKTGEECAELLGVTTRIAIQGIDEIDPGTQKVNRQRLIEEIGDVYAQLDANVEMLGLDREFIEARRARKLGYMHEWEALYSPSATLSSPAPQGEAPRGKYSDVLTPFLALMDRELHANSGNGDRPGWLSMSREVATLEIYYHVAKLAKAARDSDDERVREHAADVAKMAMMLADVCGVLEVQSHG